MTWYKEQLAKETESGMAEYNLGLSSKLIDAAEIIEREGGDDFDSLQAVTYLSLLAIELALKALLEKAGLPAATIKRRSHNLKALLHDLDECEIEIEIFTGQYGWIPASQIRSVTIDERYENATVGILLEAEDAGASTYPNEIRYGESFTHYPPQMIMKMALKIVNWAQQHWDYIRLP